MDSHVPLTFAVHVETSQVIITTNELIGFYVTQTNVKTRKYKEFAKKAVNKWLLR